MPCGGIFGLFKKNCCIKKPQIFVDCYAGNKTTPQNITKAIKVSAHGTVKCHKGVSLHDPAFLPVVSKL